MTGASLPIESPELDQVVVGKLTKRLPTEARPKCVGYMLFDLTITEVPQRFVVSTVIDAFDVISRAPLNATLALSIWPSRPYPSVTHARVTPTNAT